MKNTKKINFENLNGLRFLCFLSIFLFHSFHTDYEGIRDSPLYYFIKKDLFGNAYIGVNFFFVLSGFLITFLLIEEKKLNGQIDLKRFWIRRILRIWPLFYLCVFFGFYAFPLLKSFFGQVPNETASIYYYLSFTNNFEIVVKGSPDASSLGVLWSVAIEEQFYLIWPIILFFLPIGRYWIAFVVIVLITIPFRWYHHENDLVLELHTLSCIGDMAIGGLGAWLATQSKDFKNRIVNLNKFKIASIYLAFAIIFFFRDELLAWAYWMVPFERVIISIIVIAIILEQNYSVKSLFKMSQFKLVSRLGIITYGMYCFHFIAILIITTLTRTLSINTQLWQVLFFETIGSLALTIAISKLSYKYYEMAFLKLKEKFAYITRG